ncbi:MAG: polysaccharide biosynthesis tyrosine autokinase [Blastochloris sp.]|nr:polysaccharide biosynthesis tyrosine autokinase [Blastochloris sp.]
MAENTEVSLHFSDYWRVVKNRWPIIAILFVLVVATAFFYTRSIEKVYSSSALVKVSTGENKQLNFMQDEANPFNTIDFQTEFETIQSKKILVPVLKAQKIDEKFALKAGLPINAYKENEDFLFNSFKGGNLRVQPFRNTKLIEITVFYTDPNDAKNWANAIANYYAEYRVAEITGNKGGGLRVVEEQLQKQRNSVQTANQKVQDLRKLYEIDDQGSGPGRGAVVTLQELELQRNEAKLTETKADLLARKVRIQEVRKLSNDQLVNALSALGFEDSTLSLLKANLIENQQNLESMRKQGFAAEHPKMQASLALVEKTKDQLSKQLEGIRKGLEIDYSAQESKNASIQAEVDSLKETNRKKRTGSIREYEDAKRELATQESLLEIITARYTQVKVDSNIAIKPVEMISEAEASSVPVRPNLRLNMALSVVVGLVLGVSLAFFIEYLDTSVKSLDDVERYLNTTVVGVIPEGVNTLNLEGPDSPNAEAYRILRAKIDLKARDTGATTLTIVSGGPGEGKSTTLFNLAYVCAYSGISTLIIDTDFRRHSINSILGIENVNGLADFLLGYGSLDSYIRNTDIPNLQVITAGKLPPKCMGALSPAKMSEIVKILRPHYEVILFDSPPILGISDAAVIVHEVDMTLLAIQHRRYPRNISWRAKKVVEEVQGRFCGVVLNKVHLRSDDSYYYYTSYYGYDNGESGGGTLKSAQANAKENKRRLKKNSQKQNAQKSHETDSSKDSY